MVVLSACESGVEAPTPGDELYGLVRPFVAGGAVGVVSTLWAVPDESSSVLMEAFYRHWRDEQAAPADALRAGQLDLRRSEPHAIRATGRPMC
jgi:CHAT domain-containing protein